MRGVGQRGDIPAVIVVANGADEHGDAARCRVCHRGVDLIDGQRPLAKLGEPDDVHSATLHLPGHDSRRRLRTCLTIAAVPMTATVAPAAVIVASFFASLRPATAWWPARCSSSASSARVLLIAGCQPASRSVLQSTTQG